jgi:hypothetical protein
MAAWGRSLWMQAHQIHNMYDLHVNSLLLQGAKDWDTRKIHFLFSITMAESILRTPLFEEAKKARSTSVTISKSWELHSEIQL